MLAVVVVLLATTPALPAAATAAAPQTGACFAYVVTPTYSHRWVHLNTGCRANSDCVNVCDCDAVCIDTQAGCNVTVPPSSLHPGCRRMPNTTCRDVVCPHLHEADGRACGVCPAGSAAAGTCSSNCSRAAATTSPAPPLAAASPRGGPAPKWPSRSAPSDATRCGDDIDCNLNGRCLSGVCVCQLAWTGDDCGQLALLPVAKGAGLHAPDGPGGGNTSSWGGHVVFDEKSGKWLMFAAELVNGCGPAEVTQG